MGALLSSFSVYMCHSRLPDADQCRLLRELQRQVGTKFDEELHTPLLRRLWAALEPAGPNAPFERVSKAWTRCGFQQSDPSADVRGGGELALECLVHFAERQPAAVQRILAANRRRERAHEGPGGSYPWACAGINIARMLCEVFHVTGHMGSRGNFAETYAPFWAALGGADAFRELFVTTFSMLDDAWEEGRCTYMDFPKVIAGVRVAVLQHLHREHCPQLFAAAIQAAGTAAAAAAAVAAAAAMRVGVAPPAGYHALSLSATSTSRSASASAAPGGRYGACAHQSAAHTAAHTAIQPSAPAGAAQCWDRSAVAAPEPAPVFDLDASGFMSAAGAPPRQQRVPTPLQLARRIPVVPKLERDDQGHVIPPVLDGPDFFAQFDRFTHTADGGGVAAA